MVVEVVVLVDEEVEISALVEVVEEEAEAQATPLPEPEATQAMSAPPALATLPTSAIANH